MSQPKRYICTRVLGMFEMQDASNGDWVLASDYAALAAENERLREAGEKMADIVWHIRTPEAHAALYDWNAAKEGPRIVRN